MLVVTVGVGPVALTRIVEGTTRAGAGTGRSVAVRVEDPTAE
jgi:hypothetical protein